MRNETLTKALLAIVLWGAGGVASAQSGADDLLQTEASDRSIYANGALDVFEFAVSDESGMRWEGEAWAGTFKHRLWLRTEGTIDPDGDVASGRLDLFYDHPIATFVDVQAGVRYDLDARPGRIWAALGFEAHVPYVTKAWATLYVGDEGRAGLSLRGSYDWLLTEHLILQPELRLNLYTEDDPARAIGSGLSEFGADLRLRYEVTERLAPFVGLTYQRLVGDTAQFARRDGKRTDDARVVVGVSTWF